MEKLFDYTVIYSFSNDLLSTHLNARHWDYIVCKRAFKATLKKSMV